MDFESPFVQVQSHEYKIPLNLYYIGTISLSQRSDYDVDYTLISTAWSLELAPVDRPSVGTSAFAIERGGLQVEAGLQIDGSHGESIHSFPTMLRIGIHDRFELRPYTSIVSSLIQHTASPIIRCARENRTVYT